MLFGKIPSLMTMLRSPIRYPNKKVIAPAYRSQNQPGVLAEKTGCIQWNLQIILMIGFRIVGKKSTAIAKK